MTQNLCFLITWFKLERIKVDYLEGKSNIIQRKSPKGTHNNKKQLEDALDHHSVSYWSNIKYCFTVVFLS